MVLRLKNKKPNDLCDLLTVTHLKFFKNCFKPYGSLQIGVVELTLHSIVIVVLKNKQHIAIITIVRMI